MRLIAVLMGLLLGAIATASPLFAQSNIFAGEWRTDWGPTKVFQDGSGFRGSYKSEDGNSDNDGVFVLSRSGNTWTGYWAEDNSNEKCSAERFGTRHWGTLALGTGFSTSGFEMHWGYCQDKSPDRLWVFNIKMDGGQAASTQRTYKPSSNLRELKSGFWKGAVRSNAQGHASYCYLLAQKDDEEFTIQLYWNAQGFHVLIYSPRWSMIEGEEFSGRVRIDKKFDGLIEASIFDSESIDYVFGFNQSAINAFQSGSRISLEGPEGKKSFRLIGTRKAVDVLVDCADEYLADAGEPQTAPAPDYSAGLRAYQGDDYQGALAEWLPLAEQGHAKSQNDVGEMYRDGEGVTKDYGQAVYWFRLAADQGYSRAQNNLGIRYYNGQGVQQDHRRAAKWFRAAADQGNQMAQNNLGEMYRDGEGVARNNASAIRWFRQAAEQGYARGQKNLDELLALNAAPVEITPPAPAPTPTPDLAGSDDPAVVPSQLSFTPDQGIEVEFTNLPATGQDWLAISATDHSPEQYFELVMLQGKPRDGKHMFKPLPEGEYEVRLYLDWPAGGYQIAALSKIVVSPIPALPAPAQAQPAPAAPAPAQPVAPAAPVAPVPEPPAAPEPEPTSDPDDITGSWVGKAGPFKLITLDQIMDLVEGNATDPEGQFEGEFSSGKLTGLWASPDGSIGTACQSERLGVKNWGTIEATISGDGTTLTGAWSECDKFRTQSFLIAREGSAAALAADEPPQEQTSQPEEVATPVTTAPVEPASPSATGSYSFGQDGFLVVGLPSLPTDPFKRHAAPKFTLPNATELTGYLPVPDPRFEDLQPPLLASKAPTSLGEDVPAWDTWRHANLGNMTVAEVQAALNIENLIPYDNLRTVNPAEWTQRPENATTPATTPPPEPYKAQDIATIWSDLKGLFTPPDPYKVDSIAMAEIYGGNPVETPAFTGWALSGSNRLTQYQAGHIAGMVIEFSDGKVSELRMPDGDSHLLIIEFHKESGKPDNVEKLLLHDGSEDVDGPTYAYFSDGSPECVRNYKYFPEPDRSHKHGRHVCMGSNGFMQSDNHYLNGDDVGIWRQYREGLLYELNTYSQDRKNGLQVSYRGKYLDYWGIYENGFRNGPYRNYTAKHDGTHYHHEQGTYLADEKSGFRWRFFEDKPVDVIAMENGQELGTPFTFERDTGFIERMEIAANEAHAGQVLTFNYEGELEVIENKDENGLQGIRVKVIAGYLLHRTNYLDGQKHGLAISYYTESDGGGRPLNEIITYVNGDKKGRAVRYWYDGELDYDETN